MLSVRKFMERFPNDEACRDLLIRLRWRHGFVCPKCGEDKHSFIKKRHLYECSSCKAQTSVTAGTIMHRTKLPLKYWMLVFYWAASGERYSARKLSLVLKLNYRSALRMLHAVRQAMGRAAGRGPFAFWMPVRHRFLREVNDMIKNRAERFIRQFYRSIGGSNCVSYFREFRFREYNDYNPKQALLKLLRAGAATDWNFASFQEQDYSLYALMPNRECKSTI